MKLTNLFAAFLLFTGMQGCDEQRHHFIVSYANDGSVITIDPSTPPNAMEMLQILFKHHDIPITKTMCGRSDSKLDRRTIGDKFAGYLGEFLDSTGGKTYLKGSCGSSLRWPTTEPAWDCRITATYYVAEVDEETYANFYFQIYRHNWELIPEFFDCD